MPTNLNALIRYTTIDTALRNRSVPCTRQRMMELCSEALGEFRGQYKLVSERTIYDDLRVMKSEILGFNAPIEQTNGVYRYTDDEFVLFKPVEGYWNLLEDTIKFLIRNKILLPENETDELINRIAKIVGDPDPHDDWQKMIEVECLRNLKYHFYFNIFSMFNSDKDSKFKSDKVYKFNYDKVSKFNSDKFSKIKNIYDKLNDRKK
jgi:hypothetical protein